jgi:hypothetical protein
VAAPGVFAPHHALRAGLLEDGSARLAHFEDSILRRWGSVASRPAGGFDTMALTRTLADGARVRIRSKPRTVT